MNPTEAVSRSYQAQKNWAPGSFVSVNEIIERNIPTDTSTSEWKWTPVTLMPGESFRVISYWNAGFRGVEVALENERGQRISGISAGHLTAPWEGH